MFPTCCQAWDPHYVGKWNRAGRAPAGFPLWFLWPFFQLVSPGTDGWWRKKWLVQRLFPEVHGFSYAFFPLACSLQSSTGLLTEMMIFFFFLYNRENSAAVTRWLTVFLSFHQFPPDSLSPTSFQADWFSFDLRFWVFVQHWEREGAVRGWGNFLEGKHTSDCTKAGWNLYEINYANYEW